MAGDDSTWPISPFNIEFPSSKDGLDPPKELLYRQLCAALISEIGQKLKCKENCIFAAIVYMHRFYSVQTFKNFPWKVMAQVFMFLAAKNEEQPRALNAVAQSSRSIYSQPDETPVPEDHIEMIIKLESIILATLGFKLRVDSPQSHIIRLCTIVLGNTPQCRKLGKLAWHLANQNVSLTTHCLKMTGRELAVFCIHLANIWHNTNVLVNTKPEDQPWYYSKDVDLADPQLFERNLAMYQDDFREIMDKAPMKSKSNPQESSAPVATVPSSTNSVVPSSTASQEFEEGEVVDIPPPGVHETSQLPTSLASSGRTKSSPLVEMKHPRADESASGDLSPPPSKISKIGANISLQAYKERLKSSPLGAGTIEHPPFHKPHQPSTMGQMPPPATQSSSMPHSATPDNPQHKPVVKKPTKPLPAVMPQCDCRCHNSKPSLDKCKHTPTHCICKTHPHRFIEIYEKRQRQSASSTAPPSAKLPNGTSSNMSIHQGPPKHHPIGGPVGASNNGHLSLAVHHNNHGAPPKHHPAGGPGLHNNHHAHNDHAGSDNDSGVSY